jgi:hypothetical protein
VQQEGPVGDVLDLDPLDRADALQDPLEVCPVRREHRHVANLVVALDANEVDGAEKAFGLADRRGQRGEGSGVILQPHAHRRAEGRGLM